MDNYDDILHFMDILTIIISGILCPLIVYFVIAKHKSHKKPSKSGMPNLNNLIKNIQEIADKPFK